ncbi:unnamed protein product [Bathycoccus prasinos]
MSSSSQSDGIVNVLIALGPLSQDDVNYSIIEYFSRHFGISQSQGVCVFVLPHTANEKEELSLDAETKRKGCRKVPVSVLDDARLKKKVVDVPGASLEKTFVPEFMPLGGKLRASLFALESGANVNAIEVFEVDPESGFPHAAAAIQGICDGAFAKKASALPGERKEEPEPAFFVPRPDYVLMGTHGKSLLERFVVGSVATNVLHNVDVPSIFYRQNVEFKEKPVAGVKTEGEAYQKYAVETPPKGEGDEGEKREADQQQQQQQQQQQRNVVLLGICGTQSSIDVVKFYVKKLARENDDVILAHVPMKEQTMRSKHVTQSDVTLNLETCKKLVEVFVKDNKCEETFRLRDVINLGTKTNKTSPRVLVPREQLVEAAKGFGATMLLVGRSAFGDQNLFGKMFYVGTLPLFCTQYSPCPVCVYNPPKDEHKPKSYQF